MATAPPAVAQPDVLPDGSPYQVGWLPDGLIVGLAGLTWAVPQPFVRSLVSSQCPEKPCDRQDVPAIDRWALSRSSHAARTISDVALGAMLLLPVGLDAFEVRRSDGTWRAVGKDLVVMGEAVVINGALNEVVKLAVRRPRPLSFQSSTDQAELGKADTYLSFYSGHTSTAFAAGMAYATTYSLRHPQSRSRYVVYGCAGLAGGTVGLLRVLGGKHFPTDVMTGALIGSAIGIVVPILHRRPQGMDVLVSPEGVSLVGRF